VKRGTTLLSANALRTRAKKIRMLLLDVDGVLTDGRIILDNQGNEMKSFHVRDGHGIKLVQRSGIIVGIITGRKAEVVNIRARELAIDEVHQGSMEKVAVYESLLTKYNLRDDQVCFVGDDIVDVGILKRVGLPVAVADCDPAVLPHVRWITRSAGGRGAVREVADLLLRSQGNSTS
jgi:3-deoxy-D-manno-octulosonate 8-phosphate phosphatase (KDO 8-P phosphatase)